MNPDRFYTSIVAPTLRLLADHPEIKLPVTPEASVMVLTIAGQESAWRARKQTGGPARSYWQFELGGGVDDVFRTGLPKLKAVCATIDVPCSDPRVIFEAMAWNDTLACTMARLLLWSDPKPLPDIGMKDQAWDYYKRNWRPGMPHYPTWGGYYDRAVQIVGADPNQGKLL